MLLFARYSAPLLSLLLSQFFTAAAAAESNDVFDPDNLCSAPYTTLDLAKANQPLIVPPQETPDKDGNTKVLLALNLAYYNGPVYNTIMRTYNGIAPGPTIHVQPGGSLQIELINCLHHPLGLTGYEAHNRFSDPNTTNLHTHGPHISGESPGDNIFVTVEPQSSTLYEYYFDNNHMPGTAWYHPHFHGSTSLQVGQGVAGMLIIDHPNDYPLPDAIKDMPDIEMIVQNIHLPHLRDAANISKDEVTNYVDHNFVRTNATSSSDILMLVNMQFVPVVTMEVNKWYRWRMVMSSIDKTLAFISENQNCEFKLLAKDGIYLTDAPRDVSVVILSPGNRADVAVRCLEVGREKMNMKRIPLNRRFGRFDPEWQPTFVEVDVVPRAHNLFDPPENSSSNSSTELEVFNVPTPCYLVDLRGVDECDIETTFRNRYHCEPSPPWPGRQSPNDLCGLFGPPGDGGGDTGDFFPFVDKDTYVLEFPVGTVQEVTMTFAAFHPYHQHVNPFQIHEIQSYNESQIEDYVSTWYQVGDWHDTLQFPHPRGGLNNRFFTNVTVRYQADQFTGKMLQHCHMLQHDDKGMAAVYGVYGEEGTYWEEARRINPTCIEPTSNFTKSNRTKSGVDSTGSRRMGSSKSGKCRRKGKSSKKGPDYSESSDTNATLVTSSNDTSAASGSTTTVTYVEEPPNSPYSEDPIAEEDDNDVESDSDADSDSSGDGTAPSTTPKPPTRPSLFDPPTTSAQGPPTTPSVPVPVGPPADAESTTTTTPQLPSTNEEVDPKSPSQSVVVAAPSSAVPGSKLLPFLPCIGLLLPLLV